jgi:hypothetical protein
VKKYSRPKNTRDLREGSKIILAHGEVTGHSHQVVTDLDHDLDTDQQDYMFFEEPAQAQTPARRVLMALKPFVLRHQEHDPIYLDPAKPVMARQGDVLLLPIGQGAWEVRGQREYTPTRIVRVLD